MKQAQSEAFPKAEREECLLRLSPKPDNEGVLRIVELLYDTRHPILLPKNHVVTQLVVMDGHEKLGHGSGVEQVLTEMRSRFWIVKGRCVVRNIIESCAQMSTTIFYRNSRPKDGTVAQTKTPFSTSLRKSQCRLRWRLLNQARSRESKNEAVLVPFHLPGNESHAPLNVLFA